jgi:hypothetical protein
MKPQRHDLLEIVEDRYGKGSTVVTSPPAKPMPRKTAVFCAHLMEHAPRLFAPS